MRSAAVKISSRGSNVGMSEHDLNRAEVSARIENMGCTGMPKEMRVDAMFNVGELSRLTKHVPNGADIERRSGIPPGWKEPVLRPAAAKVDAQPFKQSGREGDVTRCAALAVPHMQHHPPTVDIADLQLLQLFAPHCGGVEGG